MSMQALDITVPFARNHRNQFPALLPVPVPAPGWFGPMAVSHSFVRNEEVYGEGEPAEYLYTIQTGCVRTSKILTDGRRQIGAFYLPGDVFGLEADDVRSFSAEALTATTVHVVKRTALFLRTATANQLLKLTVEELNRTQGRVLLLIKSAQERVAGFLLEMANRCHTSDDIELPMSRQDIADYLGLTIETVSRTLTHLESVGAISLPTSRHIVFSNRAALARLNA
jgi:CRP/FNR family transcriptional regulator, nitrogen fixation regulation protein